MDSHGFFVLQWTVSLVFLHFLSAAWQLLLISLTLLLFNRGDTLSAHLFLTFGRAAVFKADDNVLSKFSAMSFKEQS